MVIIKRVFDKPSKNLLKAALTLSTLVAISGCTGTTDTTDTTDTTINESASSLAPNITSRSSAGTITPLPSSANNASQANTSLASSAVSSITNSSATTVNQPIPVASSMASSSIRSLTPVSSSSSQSSSSSLPSSSSQSSSSIQSSASASSTPRCEDIDASAGENSFYNGNPKCVMCHGVYNGENFPGGDSTLAGGRFNWAFNPRSLTQTTLKDLEQYLIENMAGGYGNECKNQRCNNRARDLALYIRQLAEQTCE